MTITQHDPASLKITVDNSRIIHQGGLSQPIQISTALFQRLWWHTHAYGTVVGVMLLALVSFIFLSLHWSYRKFLAIRVFGSNEWNMNNSK